MRKALKDHEEESLHSCKSPSGVDRVRHQSTIPIVFEGPNIAMAATVTSDRYLHRAAGWLRHEQHTHTHLSAVEPGFQSLLSYKNCHPGVSQAG